MGLWQIRQQCSLILIAGIVLPGCHRFLPASEAQVPGRGGPDADSPVAVEAVRVERGTLVTPLTYTGTTRPEQQVVLRAQTAGTIVATAVEVGDRVPAGQVVARIDGSLLTAQVNEALAELSVRQSEVAEDQVSLIDAQAAARQAQATRDQAQLDANRLRQLADQGAIAQQAAEAAELTLVSAEQTVQSAQAQITARQEAIAAATSRVNAQQAVLDETQAQLQWVQLTAPLSATVLTKLVEPGDYVQPGTAVIELGNLGRLAIEVQVSELDIGQLSLGQSAAINLDAFPDLTGVTGRITRISPVADATSRLVPVEVTLTNPDRRIGSGLLARVQFVPAAAQVDPQPIIVPVTALSLGADTADLAANVDNAATSKNSTNNRLTNSSETTLFVLTNETEPPTATARTVTIGQHHQGKVEILEGLTPNESLIVASDRPLQANQAVRLSILSEVLPQ